MLRLTSSSADDSQQSQSANQQDAVALDAYSRSIISVVKTVGPSVVAVESGRSGQGTGFILSSDGLAVTNAHVSDGNDRLWVTLDEGDRLEAELIGEDPATDLALFQIAARDLPASILGESSKLQVGQLSVALGSPYGLHSTVSAGIVSALGRSIRGRDGRLIENVVQHTAPINPGNSGGPLADSLGHIVGVNTAIIAPAQNVGFAVPIDTVKYVVDELTKFGRVRRVQLGIAAVNISLEPNVVRRLDLLSSGGILVAEIQPGSRAAKSDLVIEDTIVQVNGRITSTIDELHRIQQKLTPDQPIVLTVLRNNQLLDVVA